MALDEQLNKLIDEGLNMISITNDILIKTNISQDHKDYLKLKLKHLSFFMDNSVYQQEQTKEFLNSFSYCINNFKEYLSNIRN